MPPVEDESSSIAGQLQCRKTQMSSFSSSLEYDFCGIAVIWYPIRTCMMFLNEKSFSLSHYLSVIPFLRWHFCTFQHFWKNFHLLFFVLQKFTVFGDCFWNTSTEGNPDKMLGCSFRNKTWTQSVDTNAMCGRRRRKTLHLGLRRQASCNGKGSQDNEEC